MRGSSGYLQRGFTVECEKTSKRFKGTLRRSGRERGDQGLTVEDNEATQRRVEDQYRCLPMLCPLLDSTGINVPQPPSSAENLPKRS